MTVQLPVFMAMYTAVTRAAAAGGRFLWIRNIARPDMWLTAAVAGLTYLAMYVSVSLAAQSESAAGGASAFARQLMILVPVVITVVALSRLSAGVALYWGVSSAFGLLQSLFMRRQPARVIAKRNRMIR